MEEQELDQNEIRNLHVWCSAIHYDIHTTLRLLLLMQYATATKENLHIGRKDIVIWSKTIFCSIILPTP